MNFNKIAIASGIIACMAAPLSAQAAGHSLNGWGQAFANAHANVSSTRVSGTGSVRGFLSVGLLNAPAASDAPQTKPEPSMPEQTAEMGQSDMENTPEASEEGPMEASEIATQEAGNSTDDASASATASLEATVQLGGLNTDAALDVVDGVYGQVNDVVDGVAGAASNTLNGVGELLGGAQSVSYAGDTHQLINVAGLVTVNTAAASMINASVMGASQISAITATTTSVMQAALAVRPGTLTGLLR